MIIDSHAHYNNNAYKNPFRYLSYDKDGYSLKEGNREQLFRDLLDANVPYSIEPGVSLQSCEEVLQLCSEYPGRIFPAMGIHPKAAGCFCQNTRCHCNRRVWLGLSLQARGTAPVEAAHLVSLSVGSSLANEEASNSPCPGCPRGCLTNSEMASSKKARWCDSLFLWPQGDCGAVPEAGLSFRYWRFSPAAGRTGRCTLGSNKAYTRR